MEGNTMKLRVTGEVPGGAVQATERARTVAALFGLTLAGKPRRLFEPLELDLRGITLITGPSGAGKSTILRAVAAAVGTAGVRLEEIALADDRPVVDCFSCDLEAALGHLARAGLAEAQVLLPLAAVALSAPTPKALPAKVLRSQFRGDGHLATVTLSGSPDVELQLLSAARLRPGEQIELSIDPGRIRWFGKEDQIRQEEKVAIC